MNILLCISIDGYKLPKYEESAGGSVADSVGSAPKLPKYESAGGSVPAVVSDSAVGPSPIDTTNAAGSGKIYYKDLICDN